MELRLFWVLLAWLPILSVSHAVPVSAKDVVDQCPEDSVLVNGTCECDHSLCKQLQCHEELTLVTNSSAVPGECCPIYTCGLCTQESIAAGICECAIGAFQDLDGNCNCKDPRKSLIEGECVCDSSKCLPRLECDEKSVLITLPRDDECCNTYACSRCPDDSYSLRKQLTHFNPEEIEDKCICFPCEQPSCPENQIVKEVIQKGTNFPGRCCTVYMCGYGTCNVNGSKYNNGDLIHGNDGKISICKNGVVILVEDNETENGREEIFGPTCLYEGINYQNDSEWMADSCTKCICINGESMCVADICEEKDNTVTVQQNCVKLSNCSETCPYGYDTDEFGCHICSCKSYDAQFDALLALKEVMKQKNLTEDDVIRSINLTLQVLGDEGEWNIIWTIVITCGIWIILISLFCGIKHLITTNIGKFRKDIQLSKVSEKMPLNEKEKIEFFVMNSKQLAFICDKCDKTC